jgi:hypothetical protein
MSTMTRLLVNFVLLAVWSWALYEAYQILVLQRTMPNTVLSLKIAYDHVKPAGTLQIETDLVRHRGCRVSVAQFIVDAQSVRFDLPPVVAPANMPPGVDVYKRSVEIPESIAPGPATLTLGTSFKCHWSHVLWPLLRPVRDVHFTVDPQQ